MSDIILVYSTEWKTQEQLEMELAYQRELDEVRREMDDRIDEQVRYDAGDYYNDDEMSYLIEGEDDLI